MLVTGAAGFIGSHVVRRLLDDEADVYAMSSSVSSLLPIRLAGVAHRIVIVEANVCDRSSLQHVIERVRPEFVIHLAAFTHVGKSFQRVEENVSTNVEGTVKLLLALDGSYERFVYAGTSEIYGNVPPPFVEKAPVNPVSPYAVAKYAGERFCRMFHEAFSWPIVCLRPFNAYGPWQTPDRVIPELILAALQGVDLRITQGHQTREFNYVTDIADGFVRTLTAPSVDGEVINIGCGLETSIVELAHLVVELANSPSTVRAGEVAYRPTEIWRMYSDSTKARTLLGWQPRWSLRDGLAATVEWYRDELSNGRRFMPDHSP